MKKEYPEFGTDKNCSLSELNVYRQKYIGEFLAKEVGELSTLEDTVLNSLKNKNTLVDKIEEADTASTFGQRLADRVASFGGSWTFILSLAAFLLVWIASNVFFLQAETFDPYP